MENNKKFDAAKMAEELWADLEANADNLRTDATKRAHTNTFFKKKLLTHIQVQAVVAELQKQLGANKAFDSLPQVIELYELWTRKQFQYFFKKPSANVHVHLFIHSLNPILMIELLILIVSIVVEDDVIF